MYYIVNKTKKLGVFTRYTLVGSSARYDMAVAKMEENSILIEPIPVCSYRAVQYCVEDLAILRKCRK